MPEDRVDHAVGGEAEAAKDGAGPVFGRVILVTASASVPMALVDLGLVHGAARSAALALAVVIVLVGVGSLFLPRRGTEL